MSLFALLSTAVAVPLSLVFAAFLWFLFRAYLAGKQKADNNSRDDQSLLPAYDKPPKISTPAISSMNLSAGMPVQHKSVAAVAAIYSASSSDTLSYQPLSTYLGDNTLNNDILSNNTPNNRTLNNNPLAGSLGGEVAELIPGTLIPGTTPIQFDVKDIPGINFAMEKELYDLGYTSIEQIARWGRADVRAVSSTLGVDQQIIEDEWIAGARLILSIR